MRHETGEGRSNRCVSQLEELWRVKRVEKGWSGFGSPNFNPKRFSRWFHDSSWLLKGLGVYEEFQDSVSTQLGQWRVVPSLILARFLRTNRAASRSILVSRLSRGPSSLSLSRLFFKAFSGFLPVFGWLEGLRWLLWVFRRGEQEILLQLPLTFRWNFLYTKRSFSCQKLRSLLSLVDKSWDCEFPTFLLTSTNKIGLRNLLVCSSSSGESPNGVLFFWSFNKTNNETCASRLLLDDTENRKPGSDSSVLCHLRSFLATSHGHNTAVPTIN